MQIRRVQWGLRVQTCARKGGGVGSGLTREYMKLKPNAELIRLHAIKMRNSIGMNKFATQKDMYEF